MNTAVGLQEWMRKDRAVKKSGPSVRHTLNNTKLEDNVRRAVFWVIVGSQPDPTGRCFNPTLKLFDAHQVVESFPFQHLNAYNRAEMVCSL